MPGVARDSDPMSHGGVVNATQSSKKANGRGIVRIGDPYSCPIHGGQTMVTGSATVKALGAYICRVGDSATCGATVVSGSLNVTNSA